MSIMISNSTFSLKEYGLVSEDDRFAMGMACQWLNSLLGYGVNIDSSMLKLLDWIHSGAKERIFRVVYDWSDGKGFLREKAEGLLETGDGDSKLFEFDRIMEHADAALHGGMRRAALESIGEGAHLLRPGMHLDRAIINFRKIFDLTGLETQLTLFLYILATWSECEQYFEDTLKCNGRTNFTVLAILLDTSLFNLRRAMKGKLERLGVLERNISGRVVFNALYSRFFEDGEPERVAESLFETPSVDPLPFDQYMLDAESRDCALELLRNAGETPTHLLLHGVPGAGKTSFAHSLARTLGLAAYTVPISRGRDDMPRAAGIEACLNMTNGGRNGLVIVDEADVVLNTSRGYLVSGERQDKGWLNELLERPGLRMVWITNSIGGVEDSVLRRFSYNMKFAPLTTAQREQLVDRILRKHRVKSLVPLGEIRSLVRRYSVSAGVVDLSVRQARAMCGRNAGSFLGTLRRLLDAAQSLALGDSVREARTHVEAGYALDGLNMDADMDALMRDFRAFDAYLRAERTELVLNRNMLLYGPPGTGKSAFARYLASSLGRELLIRRSSQLFSKYVGETEQNIAAAFREAEREGSVLLIDEADSFLYSRDYAQRTWEVGFVNEFLTQLEDYRGILVCTTNRASGLDPAASRRFNYKIKVDYLLPDGVKLLFDRVLAGYCRGKCDASACAELAALTRATPGDFKVVRDRIAIHPKGMFRARELVRMVAEESAGKEKTRSRMGF